MDTGAPAEAQPLPPPALAPALPAPGLPPPPSPTHPEPAPWIPPPKVAGQLSPAWRFVFAFGWAAVVVGYAAVWESSRVIGLSTWWLGADAEPQTFLIQLLPFYGPLLVTIAAISNWRYAAYFGIVVALAGGAIGAGDLDRVRWIAVVELVLAGAALCISVASLAGMYRPVKANSTPSV